MGSSTLPSPTSTDRPAPTSALAPISAAASTRSNLIHRQPTSTGTVATPTPTANAAAASSSSEPGAGPLPNDPNLYKRGPSPSLDGQSPDSSSSLPRDRDNVSAIPQDQRTKKRRTGTLGSRGVANLTPEQLAKKRANVVVVAVATIIAAYREAQRAIRERTKNQIEKLESRIRELTAERPYQEHLKLVREKEAAEAKVVELQKHMASVVALFQPLLPSDTAEGAFTSPVPIHHATQATQQHQQLSSSSAHNSSTPGSECTPLSTVGSPWHGQGLPLPSSHLKPGSQLVKTANEQRHPNLSIMGEQLELDFFVDPSQRLSKMQTGVNGAQDSPAFQHLPMKLDWNSVAHFDRYDATTTSGHSPPAQHVQRVEFALEPSNAQAPQVSWVGADAPIKHIPATCPLDSVLLHFMRERRQRAAEGVPAVEVVGPRYPSIFSLLNPTEASHSHPVSKVFTDILSKFTELCKIPEKVAVLYVMFIIMRWHINPTQENYELLPSFVKPLPIQFTKPHPAWVDYLPFPAMRERFVHEYNAPEFRFDDFFIPYTSTLSLNWPYEDPDALIITHDESETIINPVFMTHLSRLENWTLGDAFDRAFPSLRGTYNLKNDRDTLDREQPSS
ncbi:hypothetical protein GQX73_g3698 [Xylaria multiplex]|uniref:BZIP transcription factor n=1 Tax=Xylaria multiplex TaxID=323545 RepID=A0A7C8IV31_9PEZI|nr:hypothetical protein GQX73_g3698 [Xylaria multiplex]